MNWRRYVAAVMRYKWLVLALTPAGTALGVFATRFVPQAYVAQATVWIASAPSPGGPVRGQEILDATGMAELVRSFQILDTVAMQQKLYVTSKSRGAIANFAIADKFAPGEYHLSVTPDHKSYRLTVRENQLVDQGTLGDSIGRNIGMLWQPDPATIPADGMKFNLVAPRAAAVKLQQRLTVTLPERGSFMRLSLYDEDAGRVTRTLNSIVDRFVTLATDLKAYKLRETSRILEQQVASVGASLRDADSRLENYKTKIITLPSDATPVAVGLSVTQNTVMTRYFGEKIEFEGLQREREQLRTIVNEAVAGRLNLTGLQILASVRASQPVTQSLGDLTEAEAALRALQQHYTDSASQVKQAQERVDNLKQVIIPGQLQQTLASMDDRVAELQGHLATASTELQQIPTRMITEQRLERERLSLATINNDLQARYQAARLAEATAIPDVKILDRAVQPQYPSSNNASRIVGIAFALSLGIGLGISILLDRLDRRVRYPEQVSQTLGLSILGAIPAIKRARAGEFPAEMAAQFVEAFRTVRVNLAHAFAGSGNIHLTISSPSAGDGKSLVSSNLAVSFASAGYNTVLVDGDIRRGELHRMFSLDRKPGLLDYLQGEATLEQIVRPTNQPRLWVIPCGSRRQHGPELLGSAAMQNLLVELDQRFNSILVDSPPLAAGIDPFVLGSATGNLLMVIRSGETDRHLAEAKLGVMDRMPIRVLGAVLNDVNTNNEAYRYYSYLYGYTAEEEQETAYLPAGGDRE